MIGAGVGGVELALASAHRLARRRRHRRSRCWSAADSALPGIGAGARAALLAHLARAGITLLTGGQAARIDADA